MDKTVSNIEKGFEFYDVMFDKITRYEYLCIYPSKNPIYETPLNYHIVINKISERPERIYHTHLQDILNKKFFTYDEAKSQVRKNLENRLKRFDEDY